MTSELHKAYALLTRFKEGKMQVGKRVTLRQLNLLRLLIDDLAPRTKLPEEIDAPVFERLIFEICEQNARWNRRFMQATVQAHEACKAGKRLEGLGYLDAFIKECPSNWYRMHARAVRKDMRGG
jgi:hypothetical protein